MFDDVDIAGTGLFTVGGVPHEGFVGDELIENALDGGLFLLDKIRLLGKLVPRLFKCFVIGLGLVTDICRVYSGGRGQCTWS